MWVLKSAEAKPPRSVHRLDQPAGLSLSMVASPQCRFRFARQNYSSAAATSAANFRVARDPGGASRFWWGACLHTASVIVNGIVRTGSSTVQPDTSKWGTRLK